MTFHHSSFTTHIHQICPAKEVDLRCFENTPLSKKRLLKLLAAQFVAGRKTLLRETWKQKYAESRASDATFNTEISTLSRPVAERYTLGGVNQHFADSLGVTARVA